MSTLIKPDWSQNPAQTLRGTGWTLSRGGQRPQSLFEHVCLEKIRVIHGEKVDENRHLHLGPHELLALWSIDHSALVRIFDGHYAAFNGTYVASPSGELFALHLFVLDKVPYHWFSPVGCKFHRSAHSVVVEV